MPPPESAWYSYAIIRVVPRVERGEFLNGGIVLFARTRRFLVARVEPDVPRLQSLAPDLSAELVLAHLRAFVAIGAGEPAGGPIAALPPSERFHWLTAPRSTMIQTSPVHIGCCTDPAAALEDLLNTYVRPPRPSV